MIPNIADIISVTCDNRVDEVHMNGCQPPITGNVESWSAANTATIGGTVRLLAIKCFDEGGGWAGIVASTTSGLVSDTQWKCTDQFYPNWYI